MGVQMMMVHSRAVDNRHLLKEESLSSPKILLVTIAPFSLNGGQIHVINQFNSIIAVISMF
jgi:hypothetical protein